MHKQLLGIPDDLLAEVDQLVTEHTARRTASHQKELETYMSQVKRARATGALPPGGLRSPVTPPALSRTACLLSLIRVGLAHIKPSDLQPIPLGRPRLDDGGTLGAPVATSAYTRMMANIRADFAKRHPELAESAAPNGPELVEAPAPRRKRAKPAK